MRKKREIPKKRSYTFLVIFALILGISLGLVFKFYQNNPPEVLFSPSEEFSGSQYVNDTYIYEAFKDDVYSAQDKFYIGTAAGKFKSLIYFNISKIPSNSFILNAKLNLSIEPQTCSVRINISKITNFWHQNYTSWNNRSNAVAWNTAGGDYASEVIYSAVISAGGNYSIDITSLVTEWYDDPANNFGLVIYPGDSSECLVTIKSTQSADSSGVPKLIVNYASSPTPQLGTISSNAQTLSTSKNVGENVTFTVGWTDESTTTKLFICNSSDITTDGCARKTYCSSTNQPNPATCQYTVSYSDNRTSKFYAGICDSESCNVSAEKTFYMNHPSNITVVSPNGGEVISAGTTSYPIRFNVSDKDNDAMTAKIYFGRSENLSETLIIGNLALTGATCTDTDSNKTTTNNCTYNWDPSAYYQEQVYITVFVNDSYSLSNDSSNGLIDIKAIDDPWDPTIQNYSIPSPFYSGQDVNINVTAMDEGSSIKSLWASINTTPQTNVTLSLYQGENRNGMSGNYSGNFTGIAPGNYKLRIYALDQLNNPANSQDLVFQILKPSPTLATPTFPSKSLPYHIVRISEEINATTALKGVGAMLNVPSGFSFLNQSPQYHMIGNFTENQTRTAEWYVSVPIQTGEYLLNITYSDQYSNSWTSDNLSIEVTSDLGSGASINSIEIVGYPVVSLDDDYFAEIYFKKSGILSNPTKVEATLYNPAKQIAFGPFVVTDNPSTGVYNFTRTLVGMTGQWELLVNITDNLENYYANEFFSLISGIFDVRNIQILDYRVDNLKISFEAYNKGEIPTDLWIYWNLTDANGNPIPGQETSGDETIGVNPEEIKTLNITPKTTYVGQAKITILGRYGDSWEKEAGTSKIFTILPSGTNPPVTGGSGGGGGGSGSQTPSVNKTIDFTVSVDKEVYVSENIEKKVTLVVKNTGQQNLTNLSLELEGLSSLEYSISPKKTVLLESGKEAQFEITFKIIGQSQRIFNYVIKSDQLEKKENGVITVLTQTDFLSREISRIRGTINSLITDEESRTLLTVCSDLLDKAEQDIYTLQLANARIEVTQADNCVTNFKILANKAQSSVKTSDYSIWIILILFLIVGLLVLLIVYLAYIRISILNFLDYQKSQELQIPAEVPESKSKFDKRIEDIKRTLDQ